MIPPSPCPDSFSMCANPATGLSEALVAVPAIGLVAATIGGAALLWRERASVARHRAPVAAVLAASLFAIGLHSAFVPSGPVVLYDEYVHAEVTANLATRGSGHPCCAYEHGQCVDGGPILWPLATQVASAVMMRLTGAVDGETARSRFNRFAVFFAPLAAFAWCVLLIGEGWAAAIAAIALALWPGAIRLQSTGDLSPGAMFFMLLTFCSVELWRRWPGWAGAMATAGFLALACHSRMEMSLCAPWVLWRSSGARTGKISGAWIVAGAFALIAVPMAWLISDGVNHQTIGWTNDAGKTLGFLRTHLLGNIRYFFTMDRSSPILAAAALVGLLARPSRQAAALALTFAGWIVFDSAYHIGDFHPADGADGFRYALPIAALLTPLAAAGFGALMPDKRGNWTTVGVIAVVLMPSVLQRPFYSAAGRVAQGDAASTGRLEKQRWTDNDVIASRSVAYSHAKTGAPNVVERCSMDRMTALASRPGAVNWYLRTWGDGGGDRLNGACPHVAPATPDSGDALGPWLFEYGECPERTFTHP